MAVNSNAAIDKPKPDKVDNRLLSQEWQADKAASNSGAAMDQHCQGWRLLQALRLGEARDGLGHDISGPLTAVMSQGIV